MTEYKCGSAKSCKYGNMCKPNFNIGACSHYKAEEPQTNEEWIRSATFDEIAEEIHKWYIFGYAMGVSGVNRNDITGVVEWLKQPHTLKE